MSALIGALVAVSLLLLALAAQNISTVRGQPPGVVLVGATTVVIIPLFVGAFIGKLVWWLFT